MPAATCRLNVELDHPMRAMSSGANTISALSISATGCGALRFTTTQTPRGRTIQVPARLERSAVCKCQGFGDVKRVGLSARVASAKMPRLGNGVSVGHSLSTTSEPPAARLNTMDVRTTSHFTSPIRAAR